MRLKQADLCRAFSFDNRNFREHKGRTGFPEKDADGLYDAAGFARYLLAMTGERGEATAAALALLAPGGQLDEERLSVLVGEEGEDVPTEGADLVDKEFLGRLERFRAPAKLSKRAKQVSDLNAAQAQKAITQEKTLKTLADAGRVADTREVEQLINAFMTAHVRWLKTLAAQHGEEVASAAGIPPSKAREVLEKVRELGLAHGEEIAEAFAARAEQFRQDRTSETKQYRRRK